MTLYPVIFFILNGLLIEVLAWEIAEAPQTKSICSSITSPRKSKCPRDQFQCIHSERCISRTWYCDRGIDCSDNSDEKYCNTTAACPTDPPFVKCEDSRKCIPLEWVCDGSSNCPYGDDERNCKTLSDGVLSRSKVIYTGDALNKVRDWLYGQKTQNSADQWGSTVDRLALLFYFADENTTFAQRNITTSEIAYELKIQLLSRLMSEKIEDIPTTDLASYVNAFLLTCIDPRNFYEYDVVGELWNRVNRENFTNPYTLLALCNAGELITVSEVQKLINTFWLEHRTFWTGTQAVAVMALACASKQPGNQVDPEVLNSMTLVLKQQQFPNGTVVNLPTTALVMQALIATDAERDTDNFDDVKALEELLRSQQSDGSFGDLMTTVLVAPILTCKSLVDINSDHCEFHHTNERAALEDLQRRSEPKIPVQYSLWIGDQKYLQRNLVLRVPEDTSLYSVMETAAEVDARFKFDYSVKNSKPYVNAISGMRDNPLTGKFWFLYIVQDDEPTLSNESPADIWPEENAHYVMWYRTGSWVN